MTPAEWRYPTLGKHFRSRSPPSVAETLTTEVGADVGCMRCMTRMIKDTGEGENQDDDAATGTNSDPPVAPGFFVWSVPERGRRYSGRGLRHGGVVSAGGGRVPRASCSCDLLRRWGS